MAQYDPENIFAKILRGEIPNHTIFENEVALAFMDVMPVSKGHCLIVPKAASRNLLDADPAVLSSVMPIVQKIAAAAKSAFDADGVIVQQFNEAAAGQTVFHLHFHVVPTYEGVPLARHADKMADHEMLAAQAAAIREQL